MKKALTELEQVAVIIDDLSEKMSNDSIEESIADMITAKQGRILDEYFTSFSKLDLYEQIDICVTMKYTGFDKEKAYMKASTAKRVHEWQVYAGKATITVFSILTTLLLGTMIIHLDANIGDGITDLLRILATAFGI